MDETTQPEVEMPPVVEMPMTRAETGARRGSRGPAVGPLPAALVALAFLLAAGPAMAQDPQPGTTAEAPAAEPQEAAQDGAKDGAQDGAQGEPAPAAAPPPAPPRCDTADHAAFDFWVGEWDVYRWRDEWDLAAWRAENPDATPAVNVITRRHGGCAIHEDYSSPRGYEGSSLNFYDRSDGRWHQTWIDSTGTALYLAGGLEGRSMVLSDAPADGAPPQEGRAFSRITWTPQEDGSVRQTWEQSADGETWKVVFDGRYVRRGGSE